MRALLAALAMLASLACACGSNGGSSARSDAGYASDSGSNLALAPDAAGAPCSAASVPSCGPGLMCMQLSDAGAATCESSFVCSGPAPASFAGTGDLSVSTWAAAQQACEGPPATPTWIQSTPCSGLVFLGQAGTSNTGTFAAFDATSGALVAVVQEGTQTACLAGTATIPVSCLQAVAALTWCPLPQGGDDGG
jgi:hypothetical protein